MKNGVIGEEGPRFVYGSNINEQVKEYIDQYPREISVNSSLNYSTHSPRILKGVISMFQGSSFFQSSAVWA